ncbi:MAG TPA: hypothetical protein VJV79_18710 [Polyangiaceae bacterium]|nr:hypothetical protein [Polyangiaceae bacterium]
MLERPRDLQRRECHAGSPRALPSGFVSFIKERAIALLQRTSQGAVFSPRTETDSYSFDLDNFEFNSMHTRSGQENKFRLLNQIVRKVAILNTKVDFTPADPNHSIRDQIDGWYNNPSHANTLPACVTNQPCFNSNYVPPGWDTNVTGVVGTTELYRDVIRGNCRSCHIANNREPDLLFDGLEGFLFWFNRVKNTSLSPYQNLTTSAAALAANITSYSMPHALQSTRQFWLSPAPAALEKFYAQLNFTAAVNILHGATGGNVVTLDPQIISAIQLE